VIRRAAVALAALALVACRKLPAPGEPLAGLTPAERARFDSGRVVFDSIFTPEKGLGPLFNSTSCAECHEDPKPGGTGDEVERHATAFHPDATGRACDELASLGGPVFENQVTPALKAALGIASEPVPPQATAIAHRTTPIIFGFGLLDAVPDSVILSYADPDDRDHDGVSGRAGRNFDGRLGRFGRKALVPTLLEFTEGALNAEQGVTSPAVPDEPTVGGQALPPNTDPASDPELSQRQVEVLDAFVRFLAPPAPAKMSSDARRGRELFAQVGCNRCHIPALPTGDNPVRALAHREVPAFTDLLLHDMGPDLADICLGLATPSEFRTEPLMGLRLRKRFLHDGRASTPEQAIDQHGGEAAAARMRFIGLSATERAALLAYLQTL